MPDKDSDDFAARVPKKTGRQNLCDALLSRAEYDIIFEPRIMGESLYLLQRYFQDYVKSELEKRNVTFGDHPLLLPFMETHARELTEFVMMGVALNHHIRMPDLEQLGPDPERLRRVDMWDSFAIHIQGAEEHFVSGIGGLQQILASIEEAKGLRRDVSAPDTHNDDGNA